MVVKIIKSLHYKLKFSTKFILSRWIICYDNRNLEIITADRLTTCLYTKLAIKQHCSREKPHTNLPDRNGFLQGKETPDRSKINPFSVKTNKPQELVGNIKKDNIWCFDFQLEPDLKVLRYNMGVQLFGNNEVLHNDNTVGFQHKVIAYLETMPGWDGIHRLPVIKITARAFSATVMNFKEQNPIYH